MTSPVRWFRSALRYMRRAEPARLRAIYVAVVATLAVNGVAVPAGIDSRVQLGLSVLTVLVPLLQGEATRAVVSPAPAAGSEAELDAES